MQHLKEPISCSLSLPQRQALKALEQHTYFKLICGGSFTEPERVKALIRIYSQAGIDCVDIAPEPAILQAMEEAFTTLPDQTPRPMGMVSLPLDPDPHFRKIELQEADCILCNQCIPACPTEAISEQLQDFPFPLQIEQPLCYGCGRCVEVCPTQALSLNPFLMQETVHEVLRHPWVEAVELHTRYADPYMLSDFLKHFQADLEGKLISVCFRPEHIPVSQWQAFLNILQNITPWPLILQADGQPMSGSEADEASLPALAAARFLQQHLPLHSSPHITISGGINRQTARYLRQPEHAFIAGVGMGTMARRHVWAYLKEAQEKKAQEDEGVVLAQALLMAFKTKLV